jgi:hypothetical protein
MPNRPKNGTSTNLSATFHMKTVRDCWLLARREAERYQQCMHDAKSYGEFIRCREARDAVDSIAQVIRFGHVRKLKTPTRFL